MAGGSLAVARLPPGVAPPRDLRMLQMGSPGRGCRYTCAGGGGLVTIGGHDRRRWRRRWPRDRDIWRPWHGAGSASRSALASDSKRAGSGAQDRHARNGAKLPSVRVMRFDFIRPPMDMFEVSNDVPSGYNEAAGWARLLPNMPGGRWRGSGTVLVQRIRDRLPPAARWRWYAACTDDRQDDISARGLQRGVSRRAGWPGPLRWQEGRALSGPTGGPAADFVFAHRRWLPNWAGVEWRHFGATRTRCASSHGLADANKRWPL